MKTSEILRKLADMIDHNDGSNEVAADSSDENIADELDTFVPPLQAKIELMKKSVGVDNVYDQQDQEQSCGCDQEPQDELDIIKRIAGVPAVIQQEMVDDEPFEG